MGVVVIVKAIYTCLNLELLAAVQYCSAQTFQVVTKLAFSSSSRDETNAA